jgi:hypothetical protein
VSDVQRYGGGSPLEHLRRGRWLRVRESGRELVVGTPLALGVTRAAWAVGGGIALTAAAGVVLLVVQVLVGLGLLLLVPAVVTLLVFGRAAAIEMGARDQLRKRDRREAARVALWADEAGELPAPAAAPVGPLGMRYGHVSRRQAALPPAERRLPHAGRRELGA